MVFPPGDQALRPTAETSLHSFSRSQIVAELYRLVFVNCEGDSRF
jgi:hypothetical protein